MSKQIEQKWTIVHPLFKCDVCGEEIGREQKGYVQVDQKLVYDVEVRRRIFQDNRESRALKLQGSVPPLDLFNLSELEQAAELAKWQAVHAHCDNMPDETYYFYTQDLQTFEEVLQTNLHVADKNWAEYTDWAHFLQRQLAPYDG